MLGCLLAIGILFAAYHATSTHDKKIAISKGNYPQVGQNAIDFALKSLKEHPDTQPYGLGQDYKAADSRIDLLTSLFWNVYWKDFEAALKRHPENPWEKEDVLLAADACMKISYAISCLTLEDLEPFTEKYKEGRPKKMSYAQALTHQGSYQYRTFFFCTQQYHRLRGGLVWDSEQGRLCYPAASIPDSHAQSFYQKEKGTMQNSWNQLYNDYCDRVHLYVTEKELKYDSKTDIGDDRFSPWVVKDTGVKTFVRWPSELPT